MRRCTRRLLRESRCLHCLVQLNILAFAILLPASRILTPRYLHKTNVFLTRTLNGPLLIVLSLYQRLRLRREQGGLHLLDSRHWVARLNFDSAADELADKVFERTISVRGRQVKGIDPRDDEPPDGGLAASPTMAKNSSENSFAGFAAPIVKVHWAHPTIDTVGRLMR